MLYFSLLVSPQTFKAKKEIFEKVGLSVFDLVITFFLALLPLPVPNLLHQNLG